MAPNSGLDIRRMVRHEIAVPGFVRVAVEHSELLKLSSSAGAVDGWLPVDVVDLSGGGIGFISPIFFPRMVALRLKINGNDEGEVMLDTTVRVQRVLMTDRRPAYLVGTSYVDFSDAAVGQVDEILSRLEGEPGA